jgi:hypothetical protein
MALTIEELEAWGQENWRLADARDAWKDWYEYRIEIKKPIKTHSALRAIKKLFSGDNEQFLAGSVNASIANEWQGLFLRKDYSYGERQQRSGIMEQVRKGRKVAL